MNITEPYVKMISQGHCTFCNSQENLRVAHIVPRKTSPYYLLNPENCLYLCEGCSGLLYNNITGLNLHMSLQEQFFAVRSLLKMMDVLKFFQRTYKDLYNQDISPYFLHLGIFHQ